MSRLGIVAVLAACSSSDRVDLHSYTIASTTPATEGALYRVVVDGDVAFASDLAGFRAFSLDEAAGATPLATYAVPQGGQVANQALALRDHVLAVAHGPVIALVDVHDPANPQTLSTILANNALSRALQFDDHYLYWGDEVDFWRADITDLAHPGARALVGSQPIENLLAADGVLYATTSDRKLIVFDRPNDAIANPAAPPLGQVDIGPAGDLLRVGDELYGATGEAGSVWVVDVHDHAAPTVVASAPDTVPGTQLVRTADDQVITPATNALTYDYDIGDPAAPKEVDVRLIAHGFDSAINYGGATWHRDILLGTSAGFIVVAPTL